MGRKRGGERVGNRDSFWRYENGKVSLGKVNLRKEDLIFFSTEHYLQYSSRKVSICS